MPERKTIFITGATGFLGSHLSFRMLQQGHHLRVLARSSKAASARERVESTLRNAGGGNDALHPFSQQLEVFEGDISQPGLGLSETTLRTILLSTDEVWHCAASLSFAEEDREEIFRMNVGGTSNVLRIVEQTPGRRLHYVSTAYVAGNRPDVAMESDIDVGQTFKNPYEESKCRSELLVAEAQQKGSVRASVYRPSIVIGDSKTGRVTHFHGVYAFIRALWTTLERIRRKFPERDIVHLPLRVLGSKSGTLNFVPIDFVVEGMTAIASLESSLGGTYHLTNPEPTPNMLWLPHMSRIMGVEGIEIIGPDGFEGAPMTRLEGIFQKQMAFYYMYLQGEPRFDCGQTLRSLRGTGILCAPVTVPFIEKMAGWYVNYLKG
jgi:nucleoside-diphosphate-sugar epimerase